MTNTEQPRTIHRQDYTPPTFWIDQVELTFELDPSATVVTARLHLTRNRDQPARTLTLDGESLDLRSVSLDGTPLPVGRYQVNEHSLTIDELPDTCLLETQVVVDPAGNTSLYGLYRSAGNYCTQCEAMGFRRITYFLDRPDVMARYHVTLRGDAASCPVMLSNGNRLQENQLPDGRREVIWEDPYPKPSYLFALVAGDLRCHAGEFRTQSGRDVALEIWVEPQNIDLCEHALASLQKAMRWDEETFGCEYDLDIYMIVAVNDFNMGAMENKGLNIFNSKYVLSSPATATDDDYLSIEAVIAHEYFHNWTGNRITCRDWFQLTLKEGLTVFRDQQFTADQISAAVKRIDDVRLLRSRQFPEDAGPMAHPIRPESYISMDNFYTATVYNKGAEIIRMYHTRLGSAGFRRGMDLYFQRHDGQAVTCDDFRQAMADANDVNLDTLDRWYSQPGTPTLDVAASWSGEDQSFTLTLQQSYPPLAEEIPGALGRSPLPIPVAIGLLDRQGQPLPLTMAGETTAVSADSRILLLEQETESFTWEGLTEEPVASLLRGYSAPVRLRMQRSPEDLAFLMAHDPDPFSCWDAGQTLFTNLLLKLADAVAQSQELQLPPAVEAAFGSLLQNDTLDGSFQALALTLPSENLLGQEMSVIDPDSLHQARQYVRRQLARSYRQPLWDTYQSLQDTAAYRYTPPAIDARRLKTVVLSYLAALNEPATSQLVLDQFMAAHNMTDVQGSLILLVNLDTPGRDQALEQFYKTWRTDPLVLDKWFAVQALSQRDDALDCIEQLTQHPDFHVTNPNRVRALLGAFTQNQLRFHQNDGRGYRLIADFVLQIDPENPQLAARLVSAFNSFRRFDEERQSQIKTQLTRIADQPGLSKDVFEIVQRALRC